MTIDTKNLRQLAEAANRPMSEIGLMEHKRAAMRAMHGALLPDDVLELLDALERKDQLLKQALEALTAMQMNAKAVRSGLRICDEAIEAIIKELTALPPETKT